MLTEENKGKYTSYILSNKKKYKDFDITPQHLGQVIRDNNITENERDTNIIQKKDMVNQLIKQKN